MHSHTHARTHTQHTHAHNTHTQTNTTHAHKTYTQHTHITKHLGFHSCLVCCRSLRDALCFSSSRCFSDAALSIYVAIHIISFKQHNKWLDYLIFFQISLIWSKPCICRTLHIYTSDTQSKKCCYCLTLIPSSTWLSDNENEVNPNCSSALGIGGLACHSGKGLELPA